MPDFEDQNEVRDLLQRCVTAVSGVRSRAPANMLSHLGANVRDGQLIPAREHPVAKLRCIEVPDDIHEAVDQKDPGEREMVVASPHPVSEGAGLSMRDPNPRA